jgi:hypothetical protein
MKGTFWQFCCRQPTNQKQQETVRIMVVQNLQGIASFVRASVVKPKDNVNADTKS